MCYHSILFVPKFEQDNYQVISIQGWLFKQVLTKQRKYFVRILYMQYLKRLLRAVFKNRINIHQRGIGWTCLRRRPRQTLASSPGPRCQTRGTHLRRPCSPIRSLH
jgi:hypothetical protein